MHETKTKYEKRAISLTIGEHVVVTNQENFLILSDQKSGCLFLFVIDMTDSLTPLEIKYLGRIGVGSTLQYLDKKTIFLGSVTDNSYVLRILDNGTKDDNEMPYLSIIQTYQNLGNIIGMDLIDFDQDNKRLILASPEKQESLNLFQKGMQMSFSLMIKIPVMVKSLFWLFNKNIALCEIDKKCFFLQKTKDELHFLKEENFPLLFAFENQDKTIIISVNKIVILDTSLQVSSEILYASPILLASKSTNYLSLIIQEINCFQLQIYSMDLHLLKNIKILKPVSAIYNNDSFVFLGYWFETTLDCCKISNPGQIQQIEIGVQMSKENEINMKTNSVSCIKIWEEKFLLIGLNNGSLIIKKFEITAEENLNIFQTKYLLIGDRNIKIFHYTNGILICCEKTYALKIFDKPGNFIVEKIWVRSEKEIYSVLEIPESNQMQLENEENITNMILVTNYGIAIGSLDLLTKYMITPFGEDNDSNNRQIRDPEIKSFNNYKKSPLTKELVVVGSIYCITANNNINFDDPIKSELIVYSLKTQEILDSFNEFEEGEQISHLLYDESKDLIICTTDTLQASEKLPNELFDEIIGRIYLFYLQKENYLNSYKQKILKQIKKIEMRNPIESIKKMKENLLIFYCGSILYIYELIKKDKFLPKFDFHEIHKHDLRLTAFQLDVFEDFLIVCDPYKNVNLYNYNQEDNKLIFVAKIFLGGHLTFSSFYSKEKILCFDDNGNLIICQRKKKAETDLEKISLQVLSGLNFGEKLSNVVKINNIPCPEYKNILNKPETKTEKYSINEIIWTTESGSIGILAELPRDLYNLLKDLQESLLQEIKGKGFFGFEYEKWRQVKDFLGNRIQNNFVDGEIIKQFSQMPLEIVEKILNRMSLINKPKLSDFLLLVEDLEKKLFS